MATFLIHLLLAILFFYLINFIGKYSTGFGYTQISVFGAIDEAPGFNVTFRILAPLLLLVLASAILYALKLDRFANNIWLVVIYYFAFRITVNILLGRAPLVNWTRQTSIALLTMLGALGLYYTVLRERRTFLPDFDTIGNELWLIVIVFLFYILNSLKLENRGVSQRRSQYLRRRLTQFRDKYGDVVEGQLSHHDLRTLAYAIMIYESFNRPAIYRWIENKILYPFGLCRTLGIMQVASKQNINDRESVRRGVRKLFLDHRSVAARRRWRQYEKPSMWREVVSKYNGGDKYSAEVLAIKAEIADLVPFTQNGTPTEDRELPKEPPDQIGPESLRLQLSAIAEELSARDARTPEYRLLFEQFQQIEGRLEALRWQRDPCADDSRRLVRVDRMLRRTPLVVPDWIRVDDATSIVHVQIVAGKTEVLNGWNFNGYYNGNATIVVPEAHEIIIDWRNNDPANPHSIGIDEQVGNYPATFGEVVPAFDGAVSTHATSMVRSTQPGESETIRFTADRSGKYALVCYVPAHAATGMWIHFHVSAEGELGLRLD